MTGFRFGKEGVRNYATTARSDTPVVPDELKMTDQLRLSLFLRPDSLDTGGKFALVAGIPDRFGLYQKDDRLWLRLVSDETPYEDVLDGPLVEGAWYLLEVQWSKALNDGAPMWYLNGRWASASGTQLGDPLDSAGDRFNLAWDSTSTSNPFWRGAIREVELSSAAVWQGDQELTDTEMYARAMRLFGLAKPTTPVPTFTRASTAWVRVGGVLHKVSEHHPRATALGTLVEEGRVNKIEDSEHPSFPLSLDLDKGRYTLWFEQQSDSGTAPAELVVEVEGIVKPFEVDEDTPLVFEALVEPSTQVTITRLGDGTVTHLQLEEGVGPTSPILTSGGEGSRAKETLAYSLTESDLSREQGRLDLEVTPQLTGVRAQLGNVALAGDMLLMSLSREEVVSVDGSEDAATLPGSDLWQANRTRSFHVEWQPGTRMLSEDSLGLVAGADCPRFWV